MDDKSTSYEKLIFNYDIEILAEIVATLKKINYRNIQYLPHQFSYLAIAKEHENILNFLSKKKHLLFYYSLFPKFYRLFLSKNQRLCLDACFLNKIVTKKDLEGIFSEKLINRAISNNILLEKDNSLKFTISFMPYDDYILLRDEHRLYDVFELDSKKIKDRVWIGADSIIFAKFLKKYLKNKFYNKIIDIGSGTGIQTIISSKFSKLCISVDNNKRATYYTKLNTNINQIKNVEIFQSNMFEKTNTKFDLIFANPWFIDLEKGGLEEVPDIVEGLKDYLNKDGLCILLLNSYVKNGKDTVYDYLKNIVISRNYDLDLYTIGYKIETFRINDFRKHGIDYCVGYYAVIKKHGSGILKRYEASLLRRIRDFTFIYAYKIIKGI